MRLIKLLLIVLCFSVLAKEIDWKEIDLPPLPSDRMWCLWTSYENITDYVYMCTYTCENGMLLNIPGDGNCARAVKEDRW